MKSFGIFDGVARENHLVAAALYFPQEYAAMYGGTRDNYQDYLLERQIFLDDISINEPVLVVHVPYDHADYRTWLKANSRWPDGPEARSAWAMEKAKNDGALSRLKEKHFFLPAAPVEEQFVVSVFFGVVPVVLAAQGDLAKISQNFPGQNLVNVVKTFSDRIKEVLPFTRLSHLRCRGLKVCIGDRLVHPVYIDEVESALEKLAEQSADKADVALQVQRQYSVRQPNFILDGESMIFAPALLPLVLIGSEDAVQYAENFLDANQGEIGALSREVVACVKSLHLSVEINGAIPFVPGYEVYELLEYMYENLEEQADREHVPVRKVKRNKGWLKRIK